MKKRGFTLIELLVVIAIIGLLSSIVLISLSNAHGKGADAGVKDQLHSAQHQAEVYATTHSVGIGYSGVCSTAQASQGLAAILSNAFVLTNKAGGAVVTTVSTAGAWNNVTCHDAYGSWVIEAPLTASADASHVSMWCVDSLGNSKQEPSTGTGATATYNVQANIMTCP